MLRLYRARFSTNVERVALALAHKGLEVEWVDVDPSDRSEVVRVSGQELVPVLEHDGGILSDSPAILEFLEATYPEPPLLPADPARRAEIRVFCDWFNRVWKRPPNEIEAELTKPSPDRAKVDELAALMRAYLDLIEDMLAGGEYLLGSDLTAADVAAFPFLKYAVVHDPADDELFHRVLEEYQPLGDGHPRLAAWIERVDSHPRAL